MAVTYKVEQSGSASGPWVVVPGSPFSVLTDTVSGLQPATSYFFRITAQDLALGIASTPTVVGPVTTLSSLVETANGTLVANTTTIINASQTIGSPSTGPFTTFQLTAPGRVLRNGVADASPVAVTRLYYVNHRTYYESLNSNGTIQPGWWGDTAAINGWAATASPFPGSEGILVSTIPSQTVNVPFSVAGTLQNYAAQFSPASLQYQDATGAVLAGFDDEFTTALNLYNTRNTAAGGNWQPAIASSPDGYNDGDGDAFWINPFNPATPFPELYQWSAGTARLGIEATPSQYLTAVQNHAYIAAILDSSIDGQQLFGYFEIEVAVQKVAGLTFEASIEHEGVWPPEIDVCQIITDPGGVQWVTQIIQTGSGTRVYWSTNSTNGFDASVNHSYGVLWNSTNITFYIDRVQTAQFPTPTDTQGSYINFPVSWFILTQSNYPSFAGLGTGGGAGSNSIAVGNLPAYAFVNAVRQYPSLPFGQGVSTPGPWTNLPASQTVSQTSFSFTHPAVTTAQTAMTISVRDLDNQTTVGTSNAFAVLNVTTGAPGLVTSFASPNQTATSITLTWNPPTTGGALDHGIYQVLYKAAAAPSYVSGPTVPYATQASGSFNDNSGNVIALNSSGQVTVNSVADTGTHGATLILLIGTTLWQSTPSGWYSEPTPPASGWVGPVATSPLQSPGVTLAGLTAAQSYDVEVTVSNSSGTGSPTSPIVVSTSSVSTVPGQPVGLASVTASGNSVTLSWSPPTTGGIIDAGGYQVQYRTPAGSGAFTNGTLVPVVTPGHGSFTDASGNVWSVGTDSKVYINGTVDSVTTGVVNLMLVNGVIWQQNNANNWYSESAPNDSWTPPSTTSPLTNVHVTGLAASTSYGFQVYAFNGAGPGIPSAVVTASTTAVTAGAFQVSGAQIIDPSGNVFHVQGTAMYANNQFAAGQFEPSLYAIYNGIPAYQSLLVAFPKLDYLRIAMHVDERTFVFADNFFDEALNYLTARGVVCALESHEYTDVIGGSDLTNEAALYGRLAARYADNTFVADHTRVWFESQNEPHTTDPVAFANQATTFHTAIRNAGNTQPFVVTVNGGTPYGFQAWDNLSDLTALDNTILSIHYYPEAPDWGGGGSGNPAGYQFPDESYNSHFSMLTAVFNGLRSWGWNGPVIIGETGGTCCNTSGDNPNWPNMVQAELDHYHNGDYNGFVSWLFGPPWYGQDQTNTNGAPQTPSNIGTAYANGML